MECRRSWGHTQGDVYHTNGSTVLIDRRPAPRTLCVFVARSLALLTDRPTREATALLQDERVGAFSGHYPHEGPRHLWKGTRPHR